jgi:hypothetical protein
MRLKPIDIAIIVFVLGNSGVLYARYEHGKAIRGLVIAISFIIITAMSAAGYIFAKRVLNRKSNDSTK